jgi:hypothetical protein
MTKRYSIEIVDDLMTLLDGDNNGCDAYVLRTYEAAKQQLERWREDYGVDDREAIRLLGRFFEVEVTGKEIAQKMERIASLILKIPTLECRGSDELDYHRLHVGQIELALRTAYEVGRGATH